MSAKGVTAIKSMASINLFISWVFIVLLVHNNIDILLQIPQGDGDRPFSCFNGYAGLFEVGRPKAAHRVVGKTEAFFWDSKHPGVQLIIFILVVDNAHGVFAGRNVLKENG